MTKPDLRCFHSLCNYQRPRPVLNTQADRPITPRVSSVRRIVQVASQWQTVVHLPITSSRKTPSLPCHPPAPPTSPLAELGGKLRGPSTALGGKVRPVTLHCRKCFTNHPQVAGQIFIQPTNQRYFFGESIDCLNLVLEHSYHPYYGTRLIKVMNLIQRTKQQQNIIGTYIGMEYL